jgi:hypothetical protein
MKENRVRENIISAFVTIRHIEGKVNLANIFTKEMKRSLSGIARSLVFKFSYRQSQSLFLCRAFT